MREIKREISNTKIEINNRIMELENEKNYDNIYHITQLPGL